MPSISNLNACSFTRPPLSSFFSLNFPKQLITSNGLEENGNFRTNFGQNEESGMEFVFFFLASEEEEEKDLETSQGNWRTMDEEINDI